jgi:hypothetical protein
MTVTLEHEVFSRYLNTTFRISLGEANTLETELVSVSEHLLSPRQERFALVFRGPVQPLLNQAIYQFEHDEMGKFSLFIVPLRQDEEGTYYEVCFNRMRKQDQ